REHSVLGGDPALAGAIEKRRHLLLHRGRADHFRIAGLDQHRAFRVLREVRANGHRTNLVRPPSVLPAFPPHAVPFAPPFAPFGTTTIPASVTVKRCRSSSRS